MTFLLGLILGGMTGVIVGGMLAAAAERERQAEMAERRKRAGHVIRPHHNGHNNTSRSHHR